MGHHLTTLFPCVSMTILVEEDWDTKVPLLFRAFDTNGDGGLSQSELQYAIHTLFSVSATLSDVQFVDMDKKVAIFTEQLFADADENHDNSISPDEFTSWLTTRSDMTTNFEKVFLCNNINHFSYPRTATDHCGMLT